MEKQKQNIIIYFIVQSLSGITIYYSLRCFTINLNSLWGDLIFLFSLTLKIAIWPILFWLLPVSLSLNLTSLYIVLIIRKIPVLLLLVNYESINFISLMILLALITRIQGVFIGLEINSINGLRACRRLANIGWIIAGIYVSYIFDFFLIYSYCVLMIFFIWYKINFVSVFYIISLTAIPPFLLFWPKLSISYVLSINRIFFIIGLLFLVRVGSLVFYLKFCLS